MVLTKMELIRTKLEQKIFGTDMAKTITLINKTNPTYNDRDEIESYTSSSSSSN